MIGRAYIRAASSAVASVALATLAILAVGPVLGANADPVDPCDPTQGDQCDVVTVTVTQTPPVSSSPTSAAPTADPVVTKTITVTPTPTPKKSKTQKPATTTAAPAPALTQNPQQQTQTIPTTTEAPAVATTTAPEDNGQVVLPPAADPTPDVAATPSTGVSFEQPDPETVPIEIRAASPEYDKKTLTNRLAIVAAVLVGVALIAWLIFEGRLRRMAHAAAVRRGGPASARTPVSAAPSSPALASGYAPMVGFMQVQPYPMGYPQQPYGYPAPYGYGQPPYGYPVADPAQMQGQQMQGHQMQGQQYPAPMPPAGAHPWTEEATRPGHLPQQSPGQHPSPEDPEARR